MLCTRYAIKWRELSYNGRDNGLSLFIRQAFIYIVDYLHIARGLLRRRLLTGHTCKASGKLQLNLR